MPAGIDAFMRDASRAVDRALDRFLPKADERPATLHEAIRYMVLPGGKRIRPAVAMAVCGALGGESRRALPAACAVELIHCYSLVHDDLPCMDDDDLRRGRPSCHRKYGEATAVLVGDALQALAFEAVSRAAPPALAGALSAELARWSGPVGLVGGQALDLQEPNGAPNTAAIEAVREIHLRKTAALFVCSSRMGALSAGRRGSKDLARAGAYGRAIGLLFQVADDLLDSGREPDRLTFPGVAGVQRARAEARRLAASARRWARGSRRLEEIVEFVLARALNGRVEQGA